MLPQTGCLYYYYYYYYYCYCYSQCSHDVHRTTMSGSQDGHTVGSSLDQGQAKGLLQVRRGGGRQYRA
jgi:hypothetical protein